MIPDGWQETTVGSIAKVTSGGTPERNNAAYWTGTIPWITTSEINFNVIEQAKEYISELGLHNSSAKLFPPNTILMAMYGQGVTRGRVAILGIEATTNQACAAILPVKVCDARFLFYSLANQYSNIREMGHGSNQKNLNGEIIKEIAILLPPLPEQRKIAAILSTWDEAITLTKRLIEALRQRKQALMQLLLTDHKVLPEGWRWGFLSEFVGQNQDYVTELEDKLYPRISVKWWAKGAVVDKFDNGLDVKMKRHQLAKAGQIIVSEIWAKHGSIGIIPPDGESALITSHFYLFDFLPEKADAKGYIYRLVEENYFMRQSDDASKGTTGYASIRAKDFLRFKLPVPPPQERQFIADLLQVCDDLIALYEAYFARLQAQKRGLMQQLLTGVIRV